VVGTAQEPAGNSLNRLDAWLLRRADVLIANTQAEAEWYRRQGLPPEKVTVIPPGVRAESPSASTDLRQSLGLPADGRLLVCVGPLEQHKGFEDAIWAFDILKFLHENLHLLLIGEGSHCSRLEQFARNVRGASHIHFVGHQSDVAGLLAQADIVWIPSRVPAGLNAALEATAMGRPVVASCLPALAEIVTDGVTGLLVPPGDKVALARATRQLLDDPRKSQLLGEAGRKRATCQFACGQITERFENMYERISRESVVVNGR
jgi:glycosyltransferase involved in cell wall biosynthesis